MRANALAATLALNIVLAGALAWLWSGEERLHWAEPDALPPSLDEIAGGEPVEPAEVSRYRETLERPLFAASRKIAPRRDPAAEAQAAVDPLKDVRLLGTYGSDGRGGIIVVRDGKLERMPVGSSIGVWKVEGGEGRGAALVNAGGERRRLELALNTAAPAAPPAAGRPAVQADAAPAASAAEPARNAAAPQTAAAAPAAAPAAGQSPGGRDALLRQRLDRINALRAQRGLPPLAQ